MADKGGLLTRASAALGKIFLKRELVGVDALGNKYYKCGLNFSAHLPVYLCQTLHMHQTFATPVSDCRKFEQNVLAEPIERRWVQTPDGLYDPDAVPPEWYQWLRKRRNEAPSLREVQQ